MCNEKNIFLYICQDMTSLHAFKSRLDEKQTKRYESQEKNIFSKERLFMISWMVDLHNSNQNKIGNKPRASKEKLY